MRIALLTRSIAPANALLRRLAERGGVELVLLERFAPSQARGPLERVRRGLLDRIDGSAKASAEALERERLAVAKVYGGRADPLTELPPLLEVPHRRWEGATRALAAMRPELIVTFGTSLVPAELCRAASVAALNLHAGLAPDYRGMYCVEQALLAGDVGGVGATVHVLSPRIDAGELVAQARPRIEAGDDEETLVHRVHDLAHRLLCELIDGLHAGARLRPVAQPSGVGRLFLARDYTEAMRSELRRRVAGGLLQRALVGERALVGLDQSLVRGADA